MLLYQLHHILDDAKIEAYILDITKNNIKLNCYINSKIYHINAILANMPKLSKHIITYLKTNFHNKPINIKIRKQNTYTILTTNIHPISHIYPHNRNIKYQIDIYNQ